jgi:hypothetical protein
MVLLKKALIVKRNCGPYLTHLTRSWIRRSAMQTFSIGIFLPRMLLLLPKAPLSDPQLSLGFFAGHFHSLSPSHNPTFIPVSLNTTRKLSASYTYYTQVVYLDRHMLYSLCYDSINKNSVFKFHCIINVFGQPKKCIFSYIF